MLPFPPPLQHSPCPAGQHWSPARRVAPVGCLWCSADAGRPPPEHKYNRRSILYRIIRWKNLPDVFILQKHNKQRLIIVLSVLSLKNLLVWSSVTSEKCFSVVRKKSFVENPPSHPICHIKCCYLERISLSLSKNLNSSYPLH